jgi:SPP1 gp7 family putative phage head morphogenesis protein
MEHFEQVVLQLSAEDRVMLARSGEAMDELEARWRRRAEKYIEKIGHEISQEILKQDDLPQKLDLARRVDFAPLLVEHAFAVIKYGLLIAQKDVDNRFRKSPRLARALPQAKVPGSLSELRVMYDLWRKKGHVPPRQREEAERIKKEYLDRIQSEWKKHSRDFRKGETGDKEEIVERVRKAAGLTYARAKMTVETETTHFYTMAKLAVYDESEDVTHYLSLSIRDSRTTKWCTVPSKGGRHGLVYAKTDPLLRKEKPPRHPYCRADLAPLSPLNPAHRKLIENPRLQRRAHSCTPLLKGWGGR